MPNGRPGDHPWTDILLHGLGADRLDPEVLALIRMLRARDPAGTDQLLDQHLEWAEGENMAEARRLLSRRWREIEPGR